MTKELKKVSEKESKRIKTPAATSFLHECVDQLTVLHKIQGAIIVKMAAELKLKTRN